MRPVCISIVQRRTCPTRALHLLAFVVLLRTLASGEPHAPHSKRVSYPRRNSYNGSRRNCGISKARIASTAPWNYTVSAMPSGLSSRVSRCRHFKHAGNTAEWSLIRSVRNYTEVSKFDLCPPFRRIIRAAACLLGAFNQTGVRALYVDKNINRYFNTSYSN